MNEQLTSSQKMQGIRNLTNKQKEQLMPPTGHEIALGPFVYKIISVNIGKLRFSAELRGVMEEKRESVIGAPTLQESARILTSKGKEAL